MKTVTLLLTAMLLLLPSTSANLGLETQTFPTLKAPLQLGASVNNASLNVNNSNFLRGYSPDTLNSTFIAPLWVASFSYTNTVVNGNTTAIVAGILNNFTTINANVSTSYVPYVGASKSINLNAQNLSSINTFAFTGTFTNANGSLAMGTVEKIGAAINASGVGSFAGGTVGGVLGTAGLNGSIIATGRGSFAFGNVQSTSNGSIRAAGSGSMVIGTASGQGGSIFTSSSGALAGGIAQGTNSSISVSGNGGFVWGSASQVNSSIESSTGSIVTGDVGGLNAIVTMRNGLSVGSGTIVAGYVRGASARIEGDTGSIVHGAIGSSAANASIGSQPSAANRGGQFAGGSLQGNAGVISAFGVGSFAHGTDNFGTIPIWSKGYIMALGGGAVAIGTVNLSASGNSSFALGQNINVSGRNSFGIGLSNNTMSYISQDAVFSIMAGVVGINITNPQALLHVNGTSRFENNMTINSLVTLNLVTLPACNSATNGSIGRNLTGFYGCAIGDGNWVRFGT